MDADLIRFPCEVCGKLLGADPEMRLVVCSKCQAENEVPSRRVAAAAVAKSETEAVRIVDIDIPLRTLIRLGVGVSIAAVPLLLLLAGVALGVVWVANRIP